MIRIRIKCFTKLFEQNLTTKWYAFNEITMAAQTTTQINIIKEVKQRDNVQNICKISNFKRLHDTYCF